MEIHTITQRDLDNTPQKDHRWRWPGVTGPGQYTWSESQNTYKPVQQETSDENPHDFSRSGLGIGGLGRHEEPATWPTAATMERMDKLDAQQRCRHCGGREWTGAMFTTDPSSGLCDDCYG